MSTLTYLLSPARRKSDVVLPEDPDCANTMLGRARNASAIETTPRVLSSAPLTTAIAAGHVTDEIGTRVAVATVRGRRAVSVCWPSRRYATAMSVTATRRLGKDIGVMSWKVECVGEWIGPANAAARARGRRQRDRA